MIYLEMSRDESHGGEGWGFKECVWAPTRNKGGAKWAFWSKILDLKIGDTVLHLRDMKDVASFIGYSKVSADGFVTSGRPPDPGQWAFAENFFRANLEEFTPFITPILLDDTFKHRNNELDAYFTANKAGQKRNIFYVKQSGKLQRLNGAYLSEVDDELFAALFGSTPFQSNTHGSWINSVQTGEQLSQIKRRLGQAEFSKKIKRLYKNTCCFPLCNVQDQRFLIGSHIARWSDNNELRGHLGNGLCLCLMHDKAFELGLFTLNEDFSVSASAALLNDSTHFAKDIVAANGMSISVQEIVPLLEALREHRERTNFLGIT